MTGRAGNREREYTAPRLYEIAFDMNRKGEVDFLVHCFKRFARRPVRTVLDIACGTGPHLVRLAERGYHTTGLDLSARNIEYLGERYNYASAMARVMDTVAPARVFQIGMRTGSREEYLNRRPNFYPVLAGHPVDVVRSLLPRLRSAPLYVTIDVDVLDPSEAPGTGSPEPGGLRVPELLDIVRLLSDCQIIGGDLVEVAHAWDPSGRTGIAASWVIREAMLTWWGHVK